MQIANSLTKMVMSILTSNDINVVSGALSNIKKELIGDRRQVSLTRAKVRKVSKVRKSTDEYVYDIGMRNPQHPWFFANNMLIHNSVYFSAYPVIKDEIDRGEINWTKELAIEYYDEVAAAVNETYADFLQEKLNVPKSRSAGVIASGREIVAQSGLYIKKKRYAALVYDDEGERKDVGGKPGKLKAMGLDLRRSDTPKLVQDFLVDVLMMVLTNKTEDECIEHIREFKKQFSNLHPWQKGTPTGVKGITKYVNEIEERNKKLAKGMSPGSLTIPGHVQASINWNTLRERNGDLTSPPIADGTKVIVCYLKDNDYKFKSIAYPVDTPHLPDWFKTLPFDEELMLEKVVDKKVKNMIGVLKWDLSKTDMQEDHFGTLFSF